MPAKPRIFLDTSALKFAAERLIRGYSVRRTLRWGDAEITASLVRWREVYQNEKLRWRQWWETTCLPFVAWLASHDRIELLCHTEVRVEFWGLPKTDDPRGLFYAAPITWVEAPIVYSRIIVGGIPGLYIRDGDGLRYPNAREHQFNFLSKLQHERFLQLQKATGAYQGARPKNHNQLLDAFHIWCAEGAKADFFLAVDPKLLRHLARHRTYPPKVRCVSPSNLLSALDKAGVLSWQDALAYLRQYARQMRRPQTDHPLEGLLQMSRHLESVDCRSCWRRWFGAA